MSSPSTERSPASIFSRWLMQRRMVDLPPPLGPSRTIVSRGLTTRSMPLSTSSLPNDFHTWSAQTMASSAIPSLSLRRLALGPGGVGMPKAAPEALLEVVLTDRQHRGEREIPEARDNEQWDHLEVLLVDLLHGGEQIVARDHRDQRRHLEHRDGLVAHGWDDHPHGLGKHHAAHGEAAGHAHRIRCLVLPLVHGDDARAYELGRIGHLVEPQGKDRCRE